MRGGGRQGEAESKCYIMCGGAAPSCKRRG
mgnify:CR=1 FL=1